MAIFSGKDAESGKSGALINEPPLAKFLFGDTRSAPIWLVIRVWLGLQWLAAGWSHAQLYDFNHGSWIHNGGIALKGFWDKALTTPAGAKSAPIVYDWYFDFIKILRDGGHYEWFAWFITFGEIAVGLGLIFGGLTAIAAFFGSLMNFSFEMAGSTSVNPVLFGTAVLIILGWRTAGWWGLDRYLLPTLGTPWQPGTLFRRTGKKVRKTDSKLVPPSGQLP